MKNNKLVLVTDIPTPYRVYFFELLKTELQNRNIDFEVQFMAKSVPIRYWEMDNSNWGFPYSFPKGIHFHFGANSFHFNPGVLLGLIKSQPKWLVLGGAWNMPTCFFSAILNRFNSNITIMWAEANRYSMSYNKGGVAAIRNYFLGFIDVFAVPGKLAINTIENEWGIHNKPFLPLPNLIDENKFKASMVNKKGIDKKLPVEILNFVSTESDIVMLWPARLHENTKGIFNFLESVLNHLKDSNIKILIAGDGPDKEKLDVWIKGDLSDNVLLLGQQSEVEMLVLYAFSDILLLPSLKDPNPLSVIEGLWSGLPLFISSHCGNQQEAVKVNYNGWVIDPLSKDSIKTAFLDMKNTTKKQLTTFGENSYETAIKQFSSKNAVNKFVESLNDI